MRVPDLNWPADLFADAIVTFPDADSIPATVISAASHSANRPASQWAVIDVRSHIRRSAPSVPARLGRGREGTVWRGPNPIFRIVSRAEDLSAGGEISQP